ncbi:MAG: DUF1592 domain-containing protein, partial [Deltaproteobacteria bacterium]|nr:DUF1592 domain-containing protein [Deltaproteobacteria bacterium]
LDGAAPPPTAAPVAPMLRPPEVAACAAGEPAPVVPSVLRRLTRVEHARTLQDLLALPAEEARALVAALPPDEEVLGFDNQSRSLQVSATHIEQYMKVAEAAADRAASQAASQAAALGGCAAPLDSAAPPAPESPEGEACARAFVERLGLRAWRRPLDPEEVEGLMDLFRAGARGAREDLASPDARLFGPLDPAHDGYALVAAALLQSPHFLYRVERGAPLSPEARARVAAAGGGEVYGLTGYELASRLSYLLWRSMPDDALFAAAASGRLGTDEGLLAEAERMLADPRAAEGLWSFFEQWLALDELDSRAKDPARFPDYSPEVAALLKTEARLFLEEVVFVERDLRALLSAPFSFHNRALAEFYARGGEGVAPPATLAASEEWAEDHRAGLPLPSGDAFERVALNPARRPGLLTRGAVLALTTKPNMGDPVHRGLYVRERLLCTPLPPPPPSIVAVAPDPDPALTTREQFAVHSEDPVCAGCHRLVDPIGFGLERFDPTGRWRERENGKELDDRGDVVGTLDLDGPFAGPAELAARLAGSEQVQRCVTLNLLRYAHGRAESGDELCEVNALYEGYADAGYDLLWLLRAVVLSPAFRHLHIDEAPADPATASGAAPAQEGE